MKTDAPRPAGRRNNPTVVTVLYNGMIAPLIPFGIKGAIWYQGEFNAGARLPVPQAAPAMIKRLATALGEGDFPF